MRYIVREQFEIPTTMLYSTRHCFKKTVKNYDLNKGKIYSSRLHVFTDSGCNNNKINGVIVLRHVFTLLHRNPHQALTHILRTT